MQPSTSEFLKSVPVGTSLTKSDVQCLSWLCEAVLWDTSPDDNGGVISICLVCGAAQAGDGAMAEKTRIEPEIRRVQYDDVRQFLSDERKAFSLEEFTENALREIRSAMDEARAEIKNDPNA